MWSLAQKNNKERRDIHQQRSSVRTAFQWDASWAQPFPWKWVGTVPTLDSDLFALLFHFPGIWSHVSALSVSQYSMLRTLTCSFNRRGSLSHSAEILDCQGQYLDIHRKVLSLRSVGDPEAQVVTALGGSVHQCTDYLSKLGTTKPQKDAGSVGLFNLCVVNSSLILGLLAWMMPSFPWSAFHKQGGTLTWYISLILLISAILWRQQYACLKLFMTVVHYQLNTKFRLIDCCNFLPAESYNKGSNYSSTLKTLGSYSEIENLLASWRYYHSRSLFF